MHYPRLVQTLGRRHGSLDGQASNVLPTLLQQRHQVVDGQHDVSDQIILRHVNVANCHTHAQDLLQLELDGGLDLGDLCVQIFGVGNRGGELASYYTSQRLSNDRTIYGRHTLGKTRTQQTRNLLDKGVGGEEGVVLAGELLDELLVLVELLQVIGGHGIDTQVLSTIDIVLITENAE